MYIIPFQKHIEPASIVVRYDFWCYTICRSTIVTDTVEEYQSSMKMNLDDLTIRFIETVLAP